MGWRRRTVAVPVTAHSARRASELPVDAPHMAGSAVSGREFAL